MIVKGKKKEAVKAKGEKINEEQVVNQEEQRRTMTKDQDKRKLKEVMEERTEIMDTDMRTEGMILEKDITGEKKKKEGLNTKGAEVEKGENIEGIEVRKAVEDGVRKEESPKQKDNKSKK